MTRGVIAISAKAEIHKNLTDCELTLTRNNGCGCSVSEIMGFALFGVRGNASLILLAGRSVWEIFCHEPSPSFFLTNLIV